MSREDFDRYKHLVEQLFVGHALALGLPTNSLKLMLDPVEHRERYLWIDPPWVLIKGDKEVASGANYPDPHSPDCREKHEHWGENVRGFLDGAVLRRVTSSSAGDTEFAFDGDMRLIALVPEEPERQGWYDDWYAKETRSA